MSTFNSPHKPALDTSQRMARALRNSDVLKDLPGSSAAGGGVVRVRAEWKSTPSGRKVVELWPVEQRPGEEDGKTDAEVESDWWAVTVRVYDDVGEHLCDLAMSEDNTVAALKTRLLSMYPERSSSTPMDYDDAALDERLAKIKMMPPPPRSDGSDASSVEETLFKLSRNGSETAAETFGFHNVLGIVRDIVAPVVSDSASSSSSGEEDEDRFDDVGEVLKLDVVFDDEEDEDEGEKDTLSGKLFGGSHSQVLISYLPTDMQRSFERKLIILQNVFEMYLPAVASWSPSAHLVFAITIAAVFVELLGFALWATIAVSICYARARSEEDLRRKAEKRNLKLHTKMQQIKSEFERMKYIAEQVSSGRDMRTLNTFTKSVDLAWANAVMAATYTGFLRDWLEQKVEKTVSDRLALQTPLIFDSCSVVDFKLSELPPMASAIRVIKSQKLPDGNVALELAISATRAEFGFGIKAKLKLGIPLKIDCAFKAEKLEGRVSVVYTKTAPFAKTVRLSLADVPHTSLNINHNGVDIEKLPGVDLWIRTAIEKLTVTRLLEPNAITYNCDLHWRKHQANARRENGASKATIVQ